MTTNLKIAGILAATLSAISLLACLFAVPLILSEIQSIWNELDQDMTEFRVIGSTRAGRIFIISYFHSGNLGRALEGHDDDGRKPSSSTIRSSSTPRLVCQWLWSSSSTPTTSGQLRPNSTNSAFYWSYRESPDCPAEDSPHRR